LALGLPTERQVLFASQTATDYDDGDFGAGNLPWWKQPIKREPIPSDPCASISDSMVKALEDKVGLNMAQMRTQASLGPFAWKGIDDEDAMVLACEVILDNSVLTTLNLHHNNIGDIGAAAIAYALKGNTVLTELLLGNNRIGDTGAAAIAELLKVNMALTTLSLPNVNKGLSTGGDPENQIGDIGASAISTALNSNLDVLKVLDLKDNLISDHAAAGIAAELKFESTSGEIGTCGNKSRRWCRLVV